MKCPNRTVSRGACVRYDVTIIIIIILYFFLVLLSTLYSRQRPSSSVLDSYTCSIVCAHYKSHHDVARGFDEPEGDEKYIIFF